ncbi:DUF3048 domain-containing protein [Halobacillus campisalis]|uniref:DUF3048 domain-containing protein n=1 Tax=Halobacillus campisalis TaxID=435909 RepID=A0ABW2KA43_9BACI|nr:DUF3048 domain-containing protein [Halobacillus campisalis]
MRQFIVIFSAVIFLLLTACSGDGSSEDEHPKEKTSGITTGPVYPLTGIPAEDEVDERVFSVMVSNSREARPQSGLSKADIVYEILAEGQITRLLALYQSELPEEVGPIRSARPYFAEIAGGYDAVFAYHGAAGFINEGIQSSGIDYADGAKYDNDGILFRRTSDRQAPHNSYLLTDGFEQFLENKGYDSEKDIEPLPFSGGIHLAGEPAGEVTITYHAGETVTFDYDEERGRYLRSSNGVPSIDAENDEPISLSNVFIIKTSHEVVDDKGRREIDLTSGGEGYLLQNGEQINVEWKNVGGRILPYKKDEPVDFLPGRIWVNVIPENTGHVTVD